MKRSLLIASSILSIALLSNSLFAQTKPAAATTTTTTTTTAVKDTSAKDIAATLENVADETTLVAAIKAANLETELKGPGPFTVFAPDNAAFSTISKGRLDSLMKDPAKLPAAVNVYVVTGKYDKSTLIKALVAGKGTTTLKTVDGQTLTVAVKNKKVQLTDAQGNVAQITSFDSPVTNGVIHGINGVLMYK